MGPLSMKSKEWTAEQDFLALTERPGKLNESDVEAVYNRLRPVLPEELIGEWRGGSFDTGHPTHASLENIVWLGKTFHSTEEVDPVMVQKEGKRVLNDQAGHAVLRRVEFRGVLSTAMIYDNHPIIDHFRRVSPDMIAGAMENKLQDVKVHGTYYFYLYK
ncbi:DUF4334 domain-containing protein [Aspergillus puulaauensis]|uniref:GXWXG protein n=1 Tax=Aspergillus puulaauensis TaxID=1220207 RepID=A0A7R7XXQ2_9EURO|nr:uncharacterized protein APUU_71226S [Aspergillus puulaauensis]BCS29656.1 hypothetical protein APUU_71226S [Aspergillus puulaauensis]